jgi:ABC-2 type transport system ATP-binding protein
VSYATIADRGDEGMTIPLTTHIMKEADHLCQRVAFFVNGHIVDNDTTRKMKKEK